MRALHSACTLRLSYETSWKLATKISGTSSLARSRPWKVGFGLQRSADGTVTIRYFFQSGKIAKAEIQFPPSQIALAIPQFKRSVLWDRVSTAA